MSISTRGAIDFSPFPPIDFSPFPETDGAPMAETEDNLEQAVDLMHMLRQPLEPRGHHVGGNLLVYGDPADGLKHLSPDVFVALDAGPARRRSWKVWEEGKFPELVVEIASPSTRARDLGAKVAIYGELGAREYYIVDLTGALDPAFHGYGRRGGALVPLPSPTGAGIASPLLGLELRLVEGWLRVIDPATGQAYPTPREEREARLAEREARLAEREARLAEREARLAEEAARRAAEAQNARLQAALHEALARIERLERGGTTIPSETGGSE